MSRFAFLLVTLLSAEAVAGSVRATLDRGRASLDDELTLTIQVVGSADTPELPSSMSTDFEIQGSGQSNQVSIINGRMSSSTRYTFTLVPKHAGTLTVPAIPVVVDGTRMATEPLQLFVAAASPTPGQGGEEIYLTAELVPASGARQSAFVGEQLVYTLKVWARVDASCPSLTLPDFPNAASYDLGEQRQYRTHVDGEEVSVVEVRKAVFADKPGVLELAPVRLNCTVERNRRRGDPFGSIFGGGVRKVVRSNAPRLSIEALPPPPAGFSGLVGEVTVSAALSKNEAHTGDSVTLSLAVRGNAEMTAAPEPQIPFGGAVKVYDDKPTLRFDNTGDTLVGERTFQKALVAQSASDIHIPAPSVTYFDPKRRAYAKAEAQPLTLRIVGAGAPAAALAPPTPPPEPEGSARPTPDETSRRSAFTLRRAPGGLAAWLEGPRLALLIAAPAAVALAIRGRRAPSAAAALRKRRREAAQRALRALESSGNDAREVSRVVRELIGNRVQHHGAALSSDEALTALAASGLDPALVTRARSVLGACDAALYGHARDQGGIKDEAIALARGFVEAA